MRTAESGIAELHKVVDTLLIIPNQNLFRVANEKTTFADAFAMADQVLYSGVACITDLMVKEGLINLDFADVRAVMREMGKAMMGTGEATGEKRALTAAEAAIANPLIDDSSMKGARGLLISITGGKDLTLFEVDEAATRIREEVDQDANIIVGATFDETPRRRDPRLRRCHRHRAGADRAQRRRAGPAVTNAVAGCSGLRAGHPSGRPDRAAARRQCSAWPNAPRSWKPPAPAPRRLPPPRRSAPPAASSAPRSPRSPRRSRRKPAAGRAAAAGVLRRRHGSPDRAEAVAVPGSRRRPRRDPGAGDARNLHPAGRRASAGPRAADAEVRGPADAGPGRNPPGPRRGRGGASAEDPDVAVAAPGQCRPRPPRRRDRAADRGPRLRSAMAPMPPLPERKPQRTVAQQIAAHEPVSEYARRPAPQGLDVHGRPAPVAAAPQGDDHLGYPGLPAPAGQLKFVTILTTKKVPAASAGAFFLCPRKVAAIPPSN